MGRYGAVTQGHSALRAGAGQIAQRGGERAGCRCFTADGGRLAGAGGSLVAGCGCVGGRCVRIVAQRHCAIANGARTQAGGDRAIATAAECANGDRTTGRALVALVIHAGTGVGAHCYAAAVVGLGRRTQCGTGRASAAFGHRRLTQGDSRCTDASHGSIRRCLRGIGSAGGGGHGLVGGMQLLTRHRIRAAGAQYAIGDVLDAALRPSGVGHVDHRTGVLRAHANGTAGRTLGH